MEDPLHYAPSLIWMIKSFPGQEIGTHTFYHYYCLETGQDADTFRADLAAAVRVAKKFGLTLESFVFPRNQYNVESVSVLTETGIKSYRGKQASWLYRARSEDEESLFRRGGGCWTGRSVWLGGTVTRFRGPSTSTPSTYRPADSFAPTLPDSNRSSV
jgi:peptidoglycan/xylan/chitin deacetylase (PgdA/CDA1 family)